jgi:hypothetical protein
LVLEFFLALPFPSFFFVSCPWLRGSLASFDREFDSKKDCGFLGSLCDPPIDIPSMVFNWDLCGFAIGTFSMVLNWDLWWLFSRLERFLVGVFPRELYWC